MLPERSKETQIPPLILEHIPLEGRALLHAVESFVQKSFETLEAGLPFQLIELLASVAEAAEEGDEWLNVVLVEIERMLLECNATFKNTYPLELEAHQMNFQDLLELVRDPWEAIDLRRDAQLAFGSEGFQEKTWKDAIQSPPLSANQPLVPNILVPPIESQQQAAIPEAMQRASSEIPTRPPMAIPAWQPEYPKKKE